MTIPFLPIPFVTIPFEQESSLVHPKNPEHMYSQKGDLRVHGVGVRGAFSYVGVYGVCSAAWGCTGVFSCVGVYRRVRWCKGEM